MKRKIRHMILPDTQVRPGVPTEHLQWAGQYAVQMLPDVIVMIGDWWDLPSLSSYDKGKKASEGRRYKADIEAGQKAMQLFLAPIRAEQARRIRNKDRQWNVRLIFTLGNHEHRIMKTIQDNAAFSDWMGLEDLGLAAMGWEVFPFLQPVIVDGVAYCHYFTSGVMGKPVTSASALANKKMMSCVMGHVQNKDIAYRRRADGKSVIGIFAGVFYQHDEDYLGPQGNRVWRGVWILHDVQDGDFDEMPVSLSFLQDKYGSKKGVAA
jgi:hypothetical protein